MSGVASAPASSGNLGPGFDCVALALELRCTVTAEPADEWVLEQDGVVEHGREDDLVVRAARLAVDRPMRLLIENEIPRSRGLGSSSAVAAAAAVASLRALGREYQHAELFEIVTSIEGHADNAAAAVYGGLVLTSPDGMWRHLDLADDLKVVVGVPDYGLSTNRARVALPDTVALTAAVRSLARLGFLIEGLRTGEAATLGAASGDELHEQARAALSPLTGELIAAAGGAGALHSAWSGAGPSTIAFCTVDGVFHVAQAMRGVLDGGGYVLELQMASRGVM